VGGEGTASRKMPGQSAQDRIEAFKKKGNSTCVICELPANTVLMKHNSFVCQRCSGILREFGMTVKGITMTSWKDSDADEICKGGNKKEVKELMGGWDGSELKVGRDSDDKSVKRFIEAKYVERRWATGGGGGGGGGKDKKDKKRSKSKEPEPAPPPVMEDDSKKKKKKDKSKRGGDEGGDFFGGGDAGGGQDWYGQGGYQDNSYYGDQYQQGQESWQLGQQENWQGAGAGGWDQQQAGGGGCQGNWQQGAGMAGQGNWQEQQGYPPSSGGMAALPPSSGYGGQQDSWSQPGSNLSLPGSFQGPPGETPQQKLQRLQQMQQQLRQKLQELKDLKARQQGGAGMMGSGQYGAGPGSGQYGASPGSGQYGGGNYGASDPYGGYGAGGCGDSYGGCGGYGDAYGAGGGW